MTPELSSSLDRLAEAGYRHMKGCGVRRELRTRSAALALYDRQLGLRDRLLTADEFIHARQRDGFIAAAVNDAEQFTARALQAELARIEIEKQARGRHLKWVYGAGAALLLLIAVLWFVHRGGGPGQQIVKLAGLSSVPDVHNDSPNDAAAPLQIPAQPESRAPEQLAHLHSTGNPSGLTADSAEKGASHASSSKSGDASTAQPSTASASSSGSPSDHAAPNEGKSNEKSSERSSHASSDNPGGESESLRDPQQQANDMSGADASQENSANQQQMSGANPANRQSAANATANQSSEERQEGAKGAQGSPGAQQSQKSQQSGAQGQSSNPEASAGSSQGKDRGNSKDALKKSRGVTSMILGVPIPDRVQGLPNPGLVRTIQKKIVPKVEPVEPVDAESRGARTNLLGSVERPELQPWMKALVREYFSQDEGKTP